MVPPGFWNGLSSSINIVMGGNPSWCHAWESSNASVANITCTCAVNLYNHSQELPGGDQAHCICPSGQYRSFGNCLECPAGTYSAAPNFYSNCTPCTTEEVTNGPGSCSASQCHDNPIWVAKDKEAVALTEAAHAQQQQAEAEESRNHIMIVAIISSSAFSCTAVGSWRVMAVSPTATQLAAYRADQ